MNRTWWLVGAWLLFALPWVGCGDGNAVPDPAAMKKVEDPANFNNAAALPADVPSPMGK